jgi:hypothetical protein
MRRQNSEFCALVCHTLRVLLFVNDETRVLSSADRLDSVANFCAEDDLAPVYGIDLDVDANILAERGGADVLHLDMNSDRALTLIEVLSEQAKTGVFHVVNHIRRAVHAHFFAEKADCTFRVDSDCFAAGEARTEGVFQNTKLSSKTGCEH